MSNTPYNPFEMARKQFDHVALLLDLNEPTRMLLRSPLREFSFAIPVKMDDLSVRIFRGFRVQHNDALGPCKGGIRFHPEESIDSVRAMAMWMTWKCAVADLPLGGGTGGVMCDPHELSLGEQERLCRGWVKQMARNVGPYIDVPAPDVLTNAQHMLWMLDEFESIHGAKYPGFITGKPVSVGGSEGREESTGYGLVYVLREALKDLNMRPEETTVAVQGFGNVAQHAVDLLHQYGSKVICVSCWDQSAQNAVTVLKKSGIDLKKLRGITDRFGSIDTGKAADLGYALLPGDAWLSQPVDILIPAALENQINGDNVHEIHKSVKIIAEGANGPITPEADEAIRGRGIFLIPDLLANAGGVICSYFEQVQCNMNYFWDKDEVLGKLDQKMTAAFFGTSEMAKRKELFMRDAAYVIAMSRVVTACRDRGWV